MDIHIDIYMYIPKIIHAINGFRTPAGMIWVWGEEIFAGSARPSTDLIHTIAAMRYLGPNPT